MACYVDLFKQLQSDLPAELSWDDVVVDKVTVTPLERDEDGHCYTENCIVLFSFISVALSGELRLIEENGRVMKSEFPNDTYKVAVDGVLHTFSDDYFPNVSEDEEFAYFDCCVLIGGLVSRVFRVGPLQRLTTDQLRAKAQEFIEA